MLFDTIENDHFEVWALGQILDNTVGRGIDGYPYYMYIYSLGHFLTTKGALIDGDGYPSKNPKKGSKKVSKIT